MSVSTDSAAPRPEAAELASRKRRLLAFVLDQLAVSLPVGGVWLGAIFLAIWSAIFGAGVGPSFWPILYGIMATVAAVYFVPSTVFAGRTVGQAALGLEVIDVRTGSRPGWLAAIVRYLVLLSPYLVAVACSLLGISNDASWAFVLAPVPFLFGWSFFNPLRQGLHDAIACTAVVRRRLVPVYIVGQRPSTLPESAPAP